jgi:hypothetical protein
MDFQQAGFPTASGLAQQGTLTLAHYILARPRLTLRFPTLGSWAQKNKYESHFPLLAYHAGYRLRCVRFAALIEEAPAEGGLRYRTGRVGKICVTH